MHGFDRLLIGLFWQTRQGIGTGFPCVPGQSSQVRRSSGTRSDGIVIARLIGAATEHDTPGTGGLIELSTHNHASCTAGHVTFAATNCGVAIAGHVVKASTDAVHITGGLVDISAADGRTLARRLIVRAAAYTAEMSMGAVGDRKSTRLNSSHVAISYAVFCLNKKKNSIGLHIAYV